MPFADFAKSRFEPGTTGEKNAPKLCAMMLLIHNYSLLNYKLLGSIAQWLASLIPDQAPPGLIPSIPKILSEEKIIHVVEVINAAGCIKVDSGFKMLIKPI